MWDGANGEAGLQSSISSWYFLSLKASTPGQAYAYGLLGVVLTFLVQMAVVRKIRRAAATADAGADR